MRYRGREILLDCGIHPAQTGLPSLPVFDDVDLGKVELCLVTHFHLDHCGAVPYLLRYTWFNGTVVMTEPTKAISRLVWNDYAGFSKPQDHETSRHTQQLYTEHDVTQAIEMIQTMHFGQVRDFDGIEVSCFGAGHVVGACMFGVKIGGISLLYTGESLNLDRYDSFFLGDYSAEDERHVPRARISPSFSVQILICESTYGIRQHEPRIPREKRFLQAVRNIIARNGKCLLPIFALGRVQELLLILNECWVKNPSLHKVPIIYLSALSDKGMAIMKEYAATYGGSYVKKVSDEELDSSNSSR